MNAASEEVLKNTLSARRRSRFTVPCGAGSKDSLARGSRRDYRVAVCRAHACYRTRARIESVKVPTTPASIIMTNKQQRNSNYRRALASEGQRPVGESRGGGGVRAGVRDSSG